MKILKQQRVDKKFMIKRIIKTPKKRVKHSSYTTSSNNFI